MIILRHRLKDHFTF